MRLRRSKFAHPPIQLTCCLAQLLWAIVAWPWCLRLLVQGKPICAAHELRDGRDKIATLDEVVCTTLLRAARVKGCCDMFLMYEM
eukprot:COSAG01_NODE_10265_length_2206_cov_1.252966_2_plen_85_part_00